MVAFITFMVGMMVGMFLNKAMVRKELVERYRTAIYQMRQFKEGDGRKSFWSGTANALARMWFELSGSDEWAASNKWRKVSGD